jgi:hypothetical protein
MSNNKIIELDEKLATERGTWTEKITALAERIKYINGLEDLMSEMLSYRQILVDRSAQMSVMIKKQKARMDVLWKEAFIKYYNFDYKLTDKQKEQFLVADMTEDHQKISLLETQLDFYRESVKTLDNMGFALRNRLALKDL